MSSICRSYGMTLWLVVDRANRVGRGIVGSCGVHAPEWLTRHPPILLNSSLFWPMIRLFSLILCCAHALTRQCAEGLIHERADHRRPNHGTSDRPTVGSPPGHGTGAQLFLPAGGDSRDRDPARRVLDQVSAKGVAVPVGVPRGAGATSPMTWSSLGESSWGCDSP